VRAEDPLILRLRELSRFDDELRLSLHRHCCQLREQLLRYFPQIFALTNSLDEPWIWDLLQAAPTPAKAARLSAARVENLVAATMLAEASRALAQRDYHALRSYGGLAPVTRPSGKSKVVHAPGLQSVRAQRSLSLGARQYPT